ncbi:hypothetical protein CAEBREN_21503 [Caenorhabditis brenneri]|uniref:Uncharacterized protein n=1 Tax=Caenorhabditis brenneri TaxID=135651 RepID=G0P5S6_CAEBE|nr:hypothetical protein CAEBREN_21503 [Caenorhabditis brenneri]
MEELYEMEVELMQHRRFYKNTVNYLLTKIFAKKIRFLVILLTLLATGIGWVMFHHHNKKLPDSEYIILSFLAMATAYFVISQVMRVPFFSLNSDDFFKDDPKNFQQQQNLTGLFLKDVHPMMKRAESLSNWRFVWEMIGTAIGYSYIAICLYFFIIRYSASESGSHDAQLNGSLIVFTVFLGIILIPILLM